MQLTYNEALASIIEHTEIGYTIASQDRLWIVFTFDLDSDGEMWSLRYNRLYPLADENGLTYEMMGLGGDSHSGGGCLVWTSRAEAEFFAERWRKRIEAFDWADEEKPPVFVMNLGDDARFEAQIIGRYGVTVRDHPKFKGSEAAWKAMAEMGLRWSMWAAEHEQAEADDAEGSCP